MEYQLLHTNSGDFEEFQRGYHAKPRAVKLSHVRPHQTYNRSTLGRRLRPCRNKCCLRAEIATVGAKRRARHIFPLKYFITLTMQAGFAAARLPLAATIASVVLQANPACIAAKTSKINTYHDNISRMVDVTPDKGVGFEHWAKVFNLKQSAKSLAELERYGFRSLEDLQNAIATAKADERDCREKLKAVETDLYNKKELQKRVLAYANTKSIRDEYKALKSARTRVKFRKQHESEFIIMDSAKRYFAEHGIKKIPNYRTLQSEIEQLTSQQNKLYEELHEKREEVKRLQTIADNIAKTLYIIQEKTKSHDKNELQE